MLERSGEARQYVAVVGVDGTSCIIAVAAFHVADVAGGGIGKEGRRV